MNHAGLDAYIFSGNPNARGWISLEILQPVRGCIFGDEIEASIVLREPNLDFARQTTLAASSGEIEVLLAVEIIVL